MLTDKQRNEILNKAIETNGILLQQIVAIEEMAELTKELSKSIRGKNKKDNIIEEMADTQIMFEQIKIIYKITDKQIQDEIDFKMVRLNERLNENV